MIDWDRLVTAEQREAEAIENHIVCFRDAVQAHLDAKAHERQYDSILSAITYRDCLNPVFAAEGKALQSWRGTVWTYAASELEKIRSRTRPVPTIAEFIAELPAFAWPDEE